MIFVKKLDMFPIEKVINATKIATGKEKIEADVNANAVVIAMPRKEKSIKCKQFVKMFLSG